MAIKTGDRITLMTHPTIQLGRYEFVKAGVDVSCVIGDDPDADLEEMQVKLRYAYARALAVELGIVESAAEAIADDGMDGLKRWCLKEIGHVPQRKVGKETGERTEGTGKAARKRPSKERR